MEFLTGCPWELLNADDMVAIADSLEELLVKGQKWQLGIEKKGLRVNMGKTKIMVSGANMNLLKQSWTHPCAVCFKGTGSKTIFFGACLFWVHKKCSGS